MCFYRAGVGDPEEMESGAVPQLDGADKEGKRDKKEGSAGAKRGRGSTSGASRAPPTKTMQLAGGEKLATGTEREEEEGTEEGEEGNKKDRSTQKSKQEQSTHRKFSTYRPRTRSLSNSDSPLAPGVTTPTKTSPMTRSHSAVKKDVEFVSLPSTKKRKKGGGRWPKRDTPSPSPSQESSKAETPTKQVASSKTDTPKMPDVAKSQRTNQDPETTGTEEVREQEEVEEAPPPQPTPPPKRRRGRPPKRKDSTNPVGRGRGAGHTSSGGRGRGKKATSGDGAEKKVGGASSGRSKGESVGSKEKQLTESKSSEKANKSSVVKEEEEDMENAETETPLPSSKNEGTSPATTTASTSNTISSSGGGNTSNSGSNSGGNTSSSGGGNTSNSGGNTSNSGGNTSSSGGTSSGGGSGGGSGTTSSSGGTEKKKRKRERRASGEDGKVSDAKTAKSERASRKASSVGGLEEVSEKGSVEGEASGSGDKGETGAKQGSLSRGSVFVSVLSGPGMSGVAPEGTRGNEGDTKDENVEVVSHDPVQQSHDLGIAEEAIQKPSLVQSTCSPTLPYPTTTIPPFPPHAAYPYPGPYPPPLMFPGPSNPMYPHYYPGYPPLPPPLPTVSSQPMPGSFMPDHLSQPFPAGQPHTTTVCGVQVSVLEKVPPQLPHSVALSPHSPHSPHPLTSSHQQAQSTHTVGESTTHTHSRAHNKCLQ